ncbi:MAG TPA: thioether cross-link-forming SCIFF peptide maturase, partial [Lachnospiraceae bacterium]|nr:thioether cross-link-forming SCIFF peptide maturase [Lachnospiraceae bacterium]
MVHQYKNNGFNIVLDVNSGSIHVVDDIVYDMIGLIATDKLEGSFRKVINEDDVRASSYEEVKDILAPLTDRYTEAEVKEAYDEISGLIKEDMLFSDDVYKDFVLDFKKRKTVVKALCLHIAHDCNLACRYCFAKEGEYNQSKRELMSYEVGKRALDF